MALLVAGLALSVSTLHLGRPIYAVRALRMWRRSWLSREVLLFTMFAFAAATYSAALWIGPRGAPALGALTVALGVCAVGASARLYLAPGRPAWNSAFTIAGFWITSALLAACSSILLTRAANGARISFLALFALMVAAESARLAWLARSRVHELRGTWQLVSINFSNHLWLRFAFPCAAVALLAFAPQAWAGVLVALLVLAGEFTSRFLFFVSVVPTNMAREYLPQEAA